MTNLEKLQQAYEHIQEFLMKLHPVLSDTINKMRKTKESDLVDIGFFLRELEATFDELRKESKIKKNTIGKMLAFKAAERAIMDPESAGTIKGKYATAIPDIKEEATPPKPGSPEFDKLYKWALSLESGDTKGLLRFHYPTLGKLITQRTEDGRKPPTGIVDVRPVAKVVFRKRS